MIWFSPDNRSHIPARPGAYVLAMELSVPLDLSMGPRIAGRLAAGRYLYCGSARGPGGLRARLGRHMSKGKSLRWHVDRITEAGQVLGAWVFEDGDECELVARLAGFPVPIPGFGSSDCRVCASHLLAWPKGAVPPFSIPTGGTGCCPGPWY